MPWASCQVRKIARCACDGNAGNVFPRRRLQRKLLVSDPGKHHGSCVTHVPWCTSGSLTCSGGKNVLGIPGACATRNYTYLTRGPYPQHLISWNADEVRVNTSNEMLPLNLFKHFSLIQIPHKADTFHIDVYKCSVGVHTVTKKQEIVWHCTRVRVFYLRICNAKYNHS